MTSARYPQDPASVGDARAFVASALSEASDEMRERAVLITSELATNAIIHAHSAFTVTTTMDADQIRVAVTDGGGAVPLVRHPGQTETHGRGLLIASTLSDSWGIDTRSDSTTVWFTLSLPPASAAELAASSARRPGRPVPDGSQA
jgi:anti-sigma regulatory factor (Ser/Thr protein kinase)